MMNTVESAWKGEQKTHLQKARMGARRADNLISAHSIMLSAYITVLSGQPAWKTGFYGLLALWHGFCLCQNWRKLNHNQLDVLIQFLLKLRAKLPFAKSGKPAWGTYQRFDRFLLGLACTEFLAVRSNVNLVRPHQKALAYMTYVEVVYAVDYRQEEEEVELIIGYALQEEEAIRKETSQPQGLRQLVRVFRKAGELYGKLGLYDKAHECFISALVLANTPFSKGGAETPDQMEKINRAISSLRAVSQ